MPDLVSHANPMLQRSVEVEVNCSVQQVYDLWANLENVPRWMPLVKSVRRLRDDDELWHWTFGLGFPLLTEWTSRITQRIPLRLIAWDSVSGLSNQGSAEFFPTDRGCRLRLTLTFNLPKGMVGVFLENIGLDRWLEANLAESLNRFQSQIEAEVLR
ncbi:MAG TPA: SRPBCC family protein, partial [Allocoleopsis sp.]